MHSLRTTLLVMKRQRSPNLPLISSSNNHHLPHPTPSTPPTPQTLQRRTHHQTNKNPISISSSFKQTKRRTFTSNIKSSTKDQTTQTPSSKHQSPKWVTLNLPKSELFLPLTFPTGQTFRWKQTGVNQYTGVIKSHLISLKQLEDGCGDVEFCVHCSPDDETTAREALADYLNLGISLGEMWKEFSVSDSNFADLALHLGGARVLRQDPVECLMQFLCSSNNNIGRITKMVNFISSLGDYLGTVEGIEFYKFPTLEQLSLVSESELRAAGFGYRAKYVVGTVKALQSKSGGGDLWLTSLRGLDLNEVIEALCTLPGVGPKVASCIALFSLDQHHAVPVDTHVWQIAIRHLTPELVDARLTPKLCIRVAEAFVSKYGKYAGWAQTLLFIAELPSQKALLPANFGTPKKTKFAQKKKEESGTGRDATCEVAECKKHCRQSQLRVTKMVHENHSLLRHSCGSSLNFP